MCDSQVPDLFQMYQTESQFHLVVAVLDTEKAGEYEFDLLEPICVVHPENPCPNIGVEQPLAIVAADAIENPAPNVGGSEKPSTEKANAREPDIFDNEEEYVHVNDEHMYVPQAAQPTQPAENLPEQPSQSSQSAVAGDDAPEAQIKVLPYEHNCASTKLHEGKMATQGWCADRLSDWVKKYPNKGAKEAKLKLQEDYQIKLKYSKAWSGMKLALEQIHGKYEESFQLLFNWKSEMEKISPGTIVDIELQKIGKKHCFKRFLCCFKAMHRWLPEWLQALYRCRFYKIDW
ncbi:hypothetical protein E2562_002237 [Oryza meyeriana var. granulata]|uniref:Uncharacterized protein n=1 Tax=Oryza meyeriana var. granulata TaxID=110450 RepID=A0A6G1BII4_9ORYZ|nr:hypothetical protein E2562_002237 [Oryza meyeriana var. granulata]